LSESVQSDRHERAARAVSTAISCLTHPLSAMAVLTLVVNDHLLKGNAPPWLTGKLSDFAGLFFFPFLLALVAGLVRIPRAFRFGVLITALAFTVLKTSPAIAGGTRALFPWGSRVVVDPTDLIALVSLFLASFMWRRNWQEPHAHAGRLHAWRSLAIAIAALSAVATSAEEFPGVESVTDLGGNLYAVVQEGVATTTWVSQDAGVSWSEVEEPSTEVAEAIEADRRSWTVRCTSTAANECYRPTTQLDDFQVSMDGGLTWVDWQDDQPPKVFQLLTAEFTQLLGIGCTDQGDCWRRIRRPPSVSDIYERTTDQGASWAVVESQPEPDAETLERQSFALCQPEAETICYRALQVERLWERSNDGGVTWPDQVDEIPDVWGTVNSGDRFQVRNAACVDPDLCFRVFDPDGGAERPRLQESNDGAHTWGPSWYASPRLAGHAAGPFGVPQDLALVGDPATLIVSLGVDGIVVRSPDGEWSTASVGPVSALPEPGVVDVQRSPLLTVAWGIAFALVLPGLVMLYRSLPDRETLAVRPWWIGIPPLLIGLAFVPLVALATSSYPYGVTTGSIDWFLIWAVPALTLAGSLWWARRSSDPGAIRVPIIASLVTILITVIVLVAAQIDILGPMR